jgi:hypothetical protein
MLSRISSRPNAISSSQIISTSRLFSSGRLLVLNDLSTIDGAFKTVIIGLVDVYVYRYFYI